MMAVGAVRIIARVVIEEMGGGVGLERDVWCIPGPRAKVEPVRYFELKDRS